MNPDSVGVERPQPEILNIAHKDSAKAIAAVRRRGEE